MSMGIEEVLAQGLPYVGAVSGTSMWPLIRPKVDTVIIEPVGDAGPAPRDIALVKLGGSYVLHRVVRVGEDGVTLLGDWCVEPERGVPCSHVLGTLTGLWRGDRQLDLGSRGYACYVGLWGALTPLRRVVLGLAWRLRRVLGGGSARLRTASAPVVFSRRSDAFGGAGDGRSAAVGPTGSSGSSDAAAPASSVPTSQELEPVRLSGPAADRAARYLMRMVDAALASTPFVLPLPEGLRWGDLYRISCEHGLDAMTWFAVQGRRDVPEGVRCAWERRMQLSFFRHARMDAEREALFCALEREGIAYMPLRGSILSGYYPRPEMRTMADNDFLYGFVEPDPEGGFILRGGSRRGRDRELRRAMYALRDIMVGRGYSVELVGRGNHDTYYKEPCYNFEPHRRLVAPDSAYGPYYQNPWRFARHDDRGGCRFAMDASDEYVYTIAHAHKHVSDSGLGLRILADVCVFWSARREELDENRIDRELEVLGIAQFERTLRSLAEKLLPAVDGGALGAGGADAAAVCADAADAGRDAVAGGHVPLGPEEAALFSYLVSSGSYGTLDQQVANRLQGMAGVGVTSTGPGSGPVEVTDATRLKYTLRRLLGVDAMRGRHPLEVPIVAVGRLARAVVVKRKEVLRELRLIWRR